MTDRHFFSPARFDGIVSRFSKTGIMVIGDVMVDEYMWGDVNRISPEAPVPVVDIQDVTYRLGGAANVAQNLSKLGIIPLLVSVCGNDDNGTFLGKMLADISCSNRYILRSPERPTTQKTRIMARTQQIVRVDREKRHDLSTAELDCVIGNFLAALPLVKGVIISDYAKGVICRPLLEKVVETCRQENIFVAVDPKERHFDLYKHVTVITPNLREAHTMVGLPYNNKADDEHIRELGWNIIANLDLPYLLMTLSERGMALFERDNREFYHLPTVAKKVFDVTGAGDTVIGVFSAAITCGATPFEAAYLANHAAGITVGELGTASVDVQTLRSACDFKEQVQQL
jgi:D-beta-D-heptose 7-phosphate kinase/D-beta-D-heptose 1-phosphate adenosyltransferase